MRVPRYPGVWWLAVTTEALSLVGYVLAVTGAGTIWIFLAVVPPVLAVLPLANWAVSTAVRLRSPKWAWGIGIATVLLLFFGPLSALPTLVFALIGPTPVESKLVTTHPRLKWPAIVVTVISAIGLAAVFIGASILVAAESYDAASGQVTVIDQASYTTGTTILGVASIVGSLAFVAQLCLIVWVCIASLRLRRWGWAIACLLTGYGYLSFAFNGPTDRPTSAQVHSAAQ